jgi:hypothetical protein
MRRDAFGERFDEKHMSLSKYLLDPIDNEIVGDD